VAWKWGGESPRTLPGLGGATTTNAAPRTQPPDRRTAPFSVELLAVRGPTWVSVRRGSQTGPVLFDGTIERGKSQGFTQKRVWVNVGVPRNLVVAVAGRRLGALGADVVIVSPQGVRPISGT
jgi:Domain of unknown function (DUF4115)